MPLSDEDVREILRIIDSSQLREIRVETDGFSLHVVKDAVVCAGIEQKSFLEKWQEAGVELSDGNLEHVKKAFDLYYDFDYDLAVRDMEDTWRYLAALPESNGKVGAVGYCLGGKLCYLMCCRTDIDCTVAYYGTYIEHNIREVGNLHWPFVLHMAMKDRWVQAEVNDLLERRLAPNPLVTIHKYPGADHAFARHGGKTYSKPEADRALALTLDFFRKHLAS